MEPALAIIALAASAAIAALAADLTVAITRAAAARWTRRDPSLPIAVRRTLAIAVVGVSSLSVVRPVLASGAMAPPSVRVAGLAAHGPSPDDRSSARTGSSATPVSSGRWQAPPNS